jgi:hypothetical protein
VGKWLGRERGSCFGGVCTMEGIGERKRTFKDVHLKIMKKEIIKVTFPLF